MLSSSPSLSNSLLSLSSGELPTLLGTNPRFHERNAGNAVREGVKMETHSGSLFWTPCRAEPCFFFPWVSPKSNPVQKGSVLRRFKQCIYNSVKVEGIDEAQSDGSSILLSCTIRPPILATLRAKISAQIRFPTFPYIPVSPKQLPQVGE